MSGYIYLKKTRNSKCLKKKNVQSSRSGTEDFLSKMLRRSKGN